MKRRRCKAESCKELFMPSRPMQDVCSLPCAVEWSNTKAGQKAAQKVRRAAYRDKKLELKTKAKWLKEAQIEFNKWIRKRDANEPCISCGRYHPPSTRAGQWHAGHYRTVSGNPELRFCENNCHKECLHCNNFDSEHLVSYRNNLIKKIGLERVEWLEGHHPPQHWTIEDIKEIKLNYQKLNRENQL